MFMASSSSSSPATQVMKHDVFLSFRGEDTRNTFTSHVFGALRRKNINTFIDDKLCRGDEISPPLLNAIKASKISVIIFSKNYAASGWCLQELEQILYCRRVNRQIVMPVFYRVDPSDVRHQRGKFGDAFANLQERLKERLDELHRWKASLEEAANLSGYHINDKKPENEFIDIIVDDISGRLSNLSPVYQEDMVGGQFNVEKVISLLQIGSKGPHIVGIWGIGGIGKTTIARAVFNKIFLEFDGSYFAANVREEWEKSPGLVHLQEKLLDKILGDKNSPVEMLGGKKLLIIFDDVTGPEQIKKLIGDFDILGSGSQIIITTRDKHVLKICGVDDSNIYKVEGLCHDDALQLFHKNACKQRRPANYGELSNVVLTYAKGVPLALKVLGSFLCDRTKEDWESEMEELEKSPHEDIQKVLKISYDGLSKNQKNIFLDIACFFKGWKFKLVKNILSDCGYSQIGLRCLIDKGLITISDEASFKSGYGIITMHDLLQEMGKEIVRQESDDPQRRSRLWHHGDIHKVLRRKKGGEEIQGICLDESKINDIYFDPRCFSKMHKLRFFIVYGMEYGFFGPNCKLHGFEELEYFSSEVFSWECYPFESLPLNFQAENLVWLHMPYSNVELLWNGVQDLVNLRHIDLYNSIHLKEIPDLSKAVDLQELNLSYCRSLEILPDNIPSKSINLNHCLNLKVAARISYKVEQLNLSGTAIIESPFIEDQSRLVRLDLSFCSRLESLSGSISKCKDLEYLDIGICVRLISLPQLPRGVDVNAIYCSSLESILDAELPLQVLPLLRPQRINLDGCFNINLSKSLHKEAGQKIFKNVCYPGNEIPEWFDFKDEGSRLRQKIEQHLTSDNVLGFNMCVVVEVGNGKVIDPFWPTPFVITVRVNKTKVDLCTMSYTFYRLWPEKAYHDSSSYVYMDFVYIPEKDIGGSKDKEEYTEKNNTSLYISFDVHDFKIKMCGVHFVHGCRHPPYSSAVWYEDWRFEDAVLEPCYEELKDEEESDEEELQEEDGESDDIESLFPSSSLMRKRSQDGSSSGQSRDMARKERGLVT